MAVPLTGFNFTPRKLSPAGKGQIFGVNNFGHFYTQALPVGEMLSCPRTLIGICYVRRRRLIIGCKNIYLAGT